MSKYEFDYSKVLLTEVISLLSKPDPYALMLVMENAALFDFSTVSITEWLKVNESFTKGLHSYIDPVGSILSQIDMDD